MASMDSPSDKEYGRYPSSVARSYRSVSPPEVSPEGVAMQKTWWKSVKDSVVRYVHYVSNWSVVTSSAALSQPNAIVVELW